MTHLLEATGITKSFSGITALSEVSLNVDAGERVGLIGPNGAGKTTFFNCLLGILKPNAGKVIFDGESLNNMSVQRRSRRGIGRTFQRIELFGGTTVREHLLIAERVSGGRGSLFRDLTFRGRPTQEEISKCDAVLELLGLSPYADDLIEQLSLGKGRLVEVGRALVTEPKLLLLDEPSSGLDREETEALATTLQAIQDERGFAILLVEHDVELVSSFTERTYVLDFGRLIADGATNEVMGSAEVRHAYLGDLELNE
jgi:branched-chain amino acid transport system ATP-binding protein